MASSNSSVVLPFRIQDAVWVESKDRQCYFLTRVLEGLLTLSWKRLVVKAQTPKGPVAHVFLIGKKKDQQLLEHYLSRHCISYLIKMLRKLDSGKELNLAACWAEKVVVERACAMDLGSCRGKWVVATEEGVDNIRFYPFAEEAQAMFYFDSWKCARILFNPDADEECAGGSNVMANASIRRAFHACVKNISQQRWTVGAEFGVRNAKFYDFDTEEQARTFFKTAFALHARILFDSSGNVVKRAGVGGFAQWNNSPAHKYVLEEYWKR